MTETSTKTIHRVLLVDDDAALRRMVSLAFTSEGFQVAMVENGFQALNTLDSNEFDLIILDLQMSRMDGRTFYRQMRARGCETAVLILSAYGAAAAQRELQAQASMAKPFDPEALIRVAKDLIEAQSSVT